MLIKGACAPEDLGDTIQYYVLQKPLYEKCDLDEVLLRFYVRKYADCKMSYFMDDIV